MPRGRKNIKSTDGKPFTKDNQPKPEAKSRGWAKKRELKELANALINGTALTNAQKIASNVGIDLGDNEYTVEIIMTLRQIEKAMTKSDTKAYNAAMDRLVGKAVQPIKMSGGLNVGIHSKEIEFEFIQPDGTITEKPH